MVRWPCTDENPFHSYKNGAIPERVKSGDCRAVHEELAGARGADSVTTANLKIRHYRTFHSSLRRLRKKWQEQFLRR